MMKISYNWLKDYINIDLPPEKVSEILTSIGLEVSKLEKYTSVEGGLEGLVVGKVLTCEKHPNADKLSVTTVDIGGKVLPIVCGAPNVAEGQKVVVAPVGVTIYPVNGEPIKMKKAKIRGAVSEGMIVAEDEIGVGTSHEGIIVLPDSAKVGDPAKKYFDVYEDWIFEIDLTPNRQDAMSHFGVARDLYVYLKTNTDLDITLTLPDVSDFEIDSEEFPIPVEVAKPDACLRYSSLTFRELEIKPSPKWMQDRLKAIGQKPINNVVDITNYVLHEIGQPLHAFDADKIKGGKVIVDTVEEGTEFTLLDGRTIKLSDEDLMICDAEHTPMCIGGVMGGLNTGVTDTTKNVFLESAFFNPVWIRRTSKRHTISTDASYRFERGTDINATIWALKRAALLFKKYANAKITSQIQDVYPEPVDGYDVELEYAQLDKIVGLQLDRCLVKTILEDLEIAVMEETAEKLVLKVPTYRFDVRREADVIEEIIRIYGYNNLDLNTFQINVINQKDESNFDVRFKIAKFFSSRGFNEIIALSLTKNEYFDDLQSIDNQQIVKLLNPISKDLNVLRPTMLFAGLDNVAMNLRNQNLSLKFFEFGKTYKKVSDSGSVDDKYKENYKIALFITGLQYEPNWKSEEKVSDFYFLKSELDALFAYFGFDLSKFETEETASDLFNYGLRYVLDSKPLVEFGSVSRKILKKLDIEQEVFFAEIDLDYMMKKLPPTPEYKEIVKFPKVRRDLALLIDKKVKFKDIVRIVKNSDKRLIKQVNIFDVYESEKLPAGKKSYAISIILQDENKTLTDKQIDKTMNKVIMNLNKEIGAEVRGK